jgi:hypothetical protein
MAVDYQLAKRPAAAAHLLLTVGRMVSATIQRCRENRPDGEVPRSVCRLLPLVEARTPPETIVVSAVPREPRQQISTPGLYQCGYRAACVSHNEMFERGCSDPRTDYTDMIGLVICYLDTGSPRPAMREYHITS